MTINNYIKSENLCYSGVYGNGVYKYNDKKLIKDPLVGGSGVSPLFANINTGELYFAKRFKLGNGVRDKRIHEILQKRILHPADRSSILWPSDFIVIPKEIDNKCNLFVMQDYNEMPAVTDWNKYNMAMLFLYDGYPLMINAFTKLNEIKYKNWKNPDIRNMAYQILKAFDTVNKSGYIYGDIHLSRIFFKVDGSAFLNYSNLLYSFEDFCSKDFALYFSLKPGEYPFEFANPGLVDKKINIIDFNSQNYSLCALIFYLFFGRYCYDGKALIDLPDNTRQEHYAKFQHYHKMPFIFDKNNCLNAVDVVDEKCADLWNDCPEMLKNMFTQVLSQNMNRMEDVINPSPFTWLKCLNELGWIPKKKD